MPCCVASSGRTPTLSSGGRDKNVHLTDIAAAVGCSDWFGA
jgi:hypothetical protein